MTDIVKATVQKLIFNNKNEDKINGFRNRLAEGRYSETWKKFGVGNPFVEVLKVQLASLQSQTVMIEVQLLLDAWLTVKKVADRMGLKRDTLLKAVRAGKLHVPK